MFSRKICFLETYARNTAEYAEYADSIACAQRLTSFLQLKCDSTLSNFEPVRFVRELAGKLYALKT